MSNVLRALRRAAILCTLLLLPVAGFAGFFVQNGQLLDNNGTPFIMRGVNYPYTWFQSRPTQQDLAAIAATGSNTVRIVLSTGGQWARVNGAQVTQLIQWCKDLRMIAVLEVHDSTGWSEQASAVHISNATAYWLSSDIRAAINGQENFVIINIANEPFGNNTSANYTADTITSIQALRAAGLTHNIMIDAANWGQDWSNTMRTNAMALWNADPLRNLTFSVHMYEVYQSLSTVSTYMQGFDDMNLPLVVGEFGPINNGQFADAESVIAQAQSRGNGYLGWSWSGNGGGGTGLDMTNNFDAASLTTWGSRIVNGTNGIRATSVLATVFGTPTNNLTISPTSLSFAAAASSLPVAITANVSWTVTDNQTWITASPISGANNGSVSVSVTANTGTAARTGTVTVTGGGLTRTIAVTQAAPTANNLTLSQTALSFASATSSSAVTVTANVSWTVTDNQTWITASPTSGANNGSFTVSASANTGTSSRSGTVTVTGGGLTRTIAVTQAGQSTTNTLNVSTASLSLGSAISSGTFGVTANVAWTVADDQTWITVSPASGSNNATVTVNAISANTGTTSRTGTVTVSGGGITRTVAVTQAGQSTGGGGTCANPVTFSGNTGNFNTTGAVCYRTNANINGWGCFNFEGRTVTVGGVARTCGQLPLTRAADGYYYFAVTAGQFPWAGMYAW
jgi:mannan endo-1,4-beta-mannosidase